MYLLFASFKENFKAQPFVYPSLEDHPVAQLVLPPETSIRLPLKVTVPVPEELKSSPFMLSEVISAPSV